MPKVGIITLYEVDNYGNRLQNYAIVKLLSKMDVDSVTISISRRLGIAHLRDIAADTRESIKRMMRGERKRTRRFKSFCHFYTPSVRLVSNALGKYSLDAFIIGSDQVWNPSWGIGAREDGMQFAADVPGNRKIALSPSFGIDSIPESWTERFAVWLSSFDRLSVRESVGVDIIRKLTGKSAELLLDPTMALMPDEWLHISSNDEVPHRPYLLTYYLGDNQPVLRDCVNQYSANKALSVIDVMDKRSPVHQAGPAEFISLIANADYFVTDSFHGCVFSILFHRPFAVALRRQDGQVNMFSRIETLLNTFGLEGRVWTEGPLPTAEINWDGVDAILREERIHFLSFLSSELARTGVIA